MKMINVIRKGTVLALATLGLCLSVSASAEPQWTRVSGIFTSTGIETHNGDSFCENVNWVSHTHYLGPWRWNSYNATSIDCWTSYNYGKQEMWATQTAYCKEGGQIDQENFGCYELREVEPPEFPSNDPLCEGKRRPFEWGGIVCRSLSDMHVCFWPEGLTEGKEEEHVTDATARQIVRDCVIEHEQSHFGNVGQDCWEGRHAIWGDLNTDIAERDAFDIELACYNREKPRCQDNRDCMDQIDIRRDTIQGYINTLNSRIPN
jgi:hypothetical protein